MITGICIGIIAFCWAIMFDPQREISPFAFILSFFLICACLLTIFGNAMPG